MHKKVQIRGTWFFLTFPKQISTLFDADAMLLLVMGLVWCGWGWSYEWDKPINLQVLPPFASIDHRGRSARQRTFEKRFKETKTGDESERDEETPSKTSIPFTILILKIPTHQVFLINLDANWWKGIRPLDKNLTRNMEKYQKWMKKTPRLKDFQGISNLDHLRISKSPKLVSTEALGE